MRRASIGFLAWSLAACALASRFSVDLEGRHYRIYSTATPEQTRDLLDFLELVYATYVELLGPAPAPPGKRFPVILYRDYEQYAACKAPEDSGAFYSADDHVLVGHYNDATMRSYFAHEGMHQYMDQASGKILKLPHWFVEGIADCLGNCVAADGKLYLAVKSGVISRLRLGPIQEAILRGRAYPWEKLFQLSAKEFSADPSVCYPEAWSISHFLIAYPRYEDRTRTIPEGIYWKNLSAYWRNLRDGIGAHKQAWEAAFGGVEISKLEGEWRRYILAMNSGRVLGYLGEELARPEAERLGIRPPYSGIRVAEVAAGSSAEAAGLQVGDVIVEVQSKRLPRGAAMDSLKLWIQDFPPGKPLRVGVLRQGKPLDLQAAWDK